MISLVQECFEDAYTGRVLQIKKSVNVNSWIFLFLKVMHFTNSENFPENLKNKTIQSREAGEFLSPSGVLRMLLISETSCGVCGRKPVARSLVWKFLFLPAAQVPLCNVC